MSEETRRPEDERVPFGQALFDNIWLLFVLGLAVPILLYIVWGLIDIAGTPPAPPPG